MADLANGGVTKTHKDVRFGVRHAEKNGSVKPELTCHFDS